MTPCRTGLHVVILVELERVRTQAEFVVVPDAHFHERIEQVLREHVSLEQKRVGAGTSHDVGSGIKQPRLGEMTANRCEMLS